MTTTRLRPLALALALAASLLLATPDRAPAGTPPCTGAQITFGSPGYEDETEQHHHVVYDHLDIGPGWYVGRYFRDGILVRVDPLPDPTTEVVFRESLLRGRAYPRLWQIVYRETGQPDTICLQGGGTSTADMANGTPLFDVSWGPEDRTIGLVTVPVGRTLTMAGTSLLFPSAGPFSPSLQVDGQAVASEVHIRALGPGELFLAGGDLRIAGCTIESDHPDTEVHLRVSGLSDCSSALAARLEVDQLAEPLTVSGLDFPRGELSVYPRQPFVVEPPSAAVVVSDNVLQHLEVVAAPEGPNGYFEVDVHLEGNTLRPFEAPAPRGDEPFSDAVLRVDGHFAGNLRVEDNGGIFALRLSNMAAQGAGPTREIRHNGLLFDLTLDDVEQLAITDNVIGGYQPQSGPTRWGGGLVLGPDVQANDVMRNRFVRNQANLRILGPGVAANRIFDNTFDWAGEADELGPDCSVCFNSFDENPSPGPNVVGGPQIGGNHWAAAVGLEDANADGFWDDPVLVGVDVDGVSHFDHHPLVAPTAPVVTGFSPPVAGEGETVTITGEHLSPVTEVFFGNEPAAGFEVVRRRGSEETVAALVGPGASGTVEIVNLGGHHALPGFTFVDRVRQESGSVVFPPTDLGRLVFDRCRTVCPRVSGSDACVGGELGQFLGPFLPFGVQNLRRAPVGSCDGTGVNLPATLAPGEQLVFDVTFLPASTGPVIDETTISWSGTDGEGPFRGDAVWTLSGSTSPGPTVDFTWTPPAPAPGQEVELIGAATGSPRTWRWDFDGDGIPESGSPRPRTSFPSAGPWPVTVVVASPYGEDSATRRIDVIPTAAAPRVTEVLRQLPGDFLEGFTGTNQLDVRIDWDGSPGTVAVRVDGGAPNVVPGTPDGAVFDLSIDALPVRATGSIVEITPTNGQGTIGAAWREKVFVHPHPSWLGGAIGNGAGFAIEVANSVVTYHLGPFEFPQPHLFEDGPVDIPDWVPVLGGRFGLTETWALADGSVSNLGTGSLLLQGATGFEVAGSTIGVKLGGAGDFRFGAPSGLDLTAATFTLDLSTSVKKEATLLDVVPAFDLLAETPGLGRVLDHFAEKAKLTGSVSAGLGLAAVFSQEPGSGELRFRELTENLKVELKGTLKTALVEDRLALEAWVSGAGSAKIGLPPPALHELSFALEAGTQLKLDALWTFDTRCACPSTCTWTPATDTVCQTTCSCGPAMRRPGLLAPLDVPYSRWGETSRVGLRPVATTRSARVSSGFSESALVANVFPGAAPVRAAAGADPASALLLWVHQDPELPAEQSTDVAWSFTEDGSSWTPAARIVEDAQVELSPVAGRDVAGRVVAAWLRVADPAWSDPVTGAAELADFYRELEVVSAVFDPAAGTWGAVSALTSNAAFDTDLRLADDGQGRLMLTWLSNPGGQLMSDATAPSSLVVSHWDPAAGAWSLPAEVATGLAGVSGHTSARTADGAALLYSRDPDPATEDDGVIEMLIWDGESWTGPTPFAAGPTDQRRVRAVGDGSGTVHVVWSSGEDLVAATIDDPTPTLVRSDASSAGLADLELVAGPDRSVLLIWSEVVGEGASDLFARVLDRASGTWSVDRRLTEEAEIVPHQLTAALGPDGVVRGAYLAEAIGRTSQVVDFGNGPVTIENLPAAGETEIRLLEHALSIDLAVHDDDLGLDPGAPGGSLAGSLTVHNSGEYPVPAVDVRFWAGEPGLGVDLGAISTGGTLPGGDRVVLSFDFVDPGGAGDLVAVVDEGGAVDESSEANNVARTRRGNGAPVAVVVASPLAGTPPLEVTADASGSFDPEGDPLSFAWTFSDGGGGETGAAVSRTFTELGTRTVAVTVRDDRGGVDAAFVKILVDLDGDGDGLVDGVDVCPAIGDPDQEDGDGDLVGDACDCAPADPALGTPTCGGACGPPGIGCPPEVFADGFESGDSSAWAG